MKKFAQFVIGLAVGIVAFSLLDSLIEVALLAACGLVAYKVWTQREIKHEENN